MVLLWPKCCSYAPMLIRCTSAATGLPQAVACVNTTKCVDMVVYLCLVWYDQVGTRLVPFWVLVSPWSPLQLTGASDTRELCSGCQQPFSDCNWYTHTTGMMQASFGDA